MTEPAESTGKEAPLPVSEAATPTEQPSAPEAARGRRWWPWILAGLCAIAAEAVFFWNDSFLRTVAWAAFSRVCSGMDAVPHGVWRLWLVGAAAGWGYSVWAACQPKAERWVLRAAWLLPFLILWPGLAMFAGFGFENAFLWVVAGTVALAVALVSLGIGL